MDSHEHEHSEIFKQDAIGFFTKRVPKADWYRGDILKCRYCTDMIFLPSKPDYQCVPVKIATVIDLEAVNF